eukprot:NODE_5710_length_560_cov_341.265347.p4 GENE.NODE_5710_length_560_cov_341.265347~~NODE_5710_length_560_cov_341.265347.p4  ORF type:complete len:75 (+),score=1.75 NODE_5710_length_560_cov_341.265347:275-499(+)
MPSALSYGIRNAIACPLRRRMLCARGAILMLGRLAAKMAVCAVEEVEVARILNGPLFWRGSQAATPWFGMSRGL